MRILVYKEIELSYLTRIKNLIFEIQPRKYLLNPENRRNLRESGVTGRSGIT
jgi:hypothetical protein